MSCKYEHLLSPIQVGSRVLKNRMISTPSGMHLNRATEPFPTDTLFAYYEGKARNGASMMTVNGMTMYYSEGGDGAGDYDMMKRGNRQAIARLVNGIHMYSCLATVNMHLHLPQGYDVCGGLPNQWLSPHGMEWGTRTDLKTAPIDMLEQFAEEYTDNIALMALECGFDGCFLHMAYRMMPLGRFLSPLSNQRDDKYGGSLENNFRYPKLIADLIKKKCGKDFIVEASISGCDPDGQGGLTTDDVAEYVKMAQGSFDMLQIKAPELDPAHPIPFELRKTPWLDLCGEIKEKSGGVLPLMTVGGFTMPELGEEALASGKTDLIGMARSWISNPDWVKLMIEGREDDIVPCLRCNKCHRSSEADPAIPVCSVNPLYGIDHMVPRLVKAPDGKKKIGIVGGGPAGLRAAIYLHDRGHDVTVYEAQPVLGGQLEITKDVEFKWTLRDYRNWLVRQVEKRPGIRVLMNTRATREMLAEADYDVILIGVGAEPKLPPIPGVEKALRLLDVYLNQLPVGERVVIIGGGLTGSEIAYELALLGKKPIIVEMKDDLVSQKGVCLANSSYLREWFALHNVPVYLEATLKEVKDGSILCTQNGKELEIACDSVISSAGYIPAPLAPSAKNVHLVGDCLKVGNLRSVIWRAYEVAMKI